MLRIGKKGPSQPTIGSPDSLKVLAAKDGHPEFAPGRRTGDAAQRSAQVTPAAVTADEAALIAANRARLAELHALPASSAADFPDALITSLTQWVPGLSQTMTLVALKDAGLLPDEAVIAGATGLAFIANWLADRGYAPHVSESGQAVPPLFYGDAVGLVRWLLLDWINRSIIAASVDDSQLEDELDAYYPRWSRTDFEWDFRRLGQGPVLNPTPFGNLAPNGLPQTATTNQPTIPRNPIRTPPAPTPRITGTALGSAHPPLAVNRPPALNRARERRTQR